MACMRETGQSLTRPLRAHPVVAGFAEAVLPKAKYKSWWAIDMIRTHWPPHKRGARRVRAHHTSTPELAQTKRTVAKTACKIFIFRHALSSPIPSYYYIISTCSHTVLTRLGLSCVGVRSNHVCRVYALLLRLGLSGLMHVDSSEGP